MTSSLVGSEMCIRDRAMRTRSGMQTADWINPMWPPASPPTTIQGQHSVSYTHLTLPTICSV
eukprot:11954633-Prorocentrum_lima.AAC.1